METNACPRCGQWLFADHTCRCGWPRTKVRRQRTCVLIDRAESSAALRESCAVPGCCNPYLAARQLCWPHYRRQLERVPGNRGKGLGCYRGLPRKIIQLRVAQKKEEKQRWKQRQREARQVLFGKGRGFMKNLSLGDRAFVNRIIHESHDLHCLRRSMQDAVPMRFRAFRLRWYGAQKLNWRRFDVPHMIDQRELKETVRKDF